MAVDFSQDIKTTERQITSYVRRGQKIPKDVLNHYNNLLSGAINSEKVNNGQSDSFPSGSLSSVFANVPNTDSTILTAGSRQYLLIQNIGNDVVFINFNAAAGVNIGLKLFPGSSWTTQFPQFVNTTIHAIAENTSSHVAIYTIG